MPPGSTIVAPYIFVFCSIGHCAVARTAKVIEDAYGSHIACPLQRMSLFLPVRVGDGHVLDVLVFSNSFGAALAADS